MSALPMSEACPADFARAALRRIAELRLPPTPRNFSRYYCEASREPPPPDTAPPVDAKLVKRVGSLVARASATTEQLVSGLGQHNDELATSLEGLIEAQASIETTQLLQEVVATTRDMHTTVTASHAELLDARRSLADIMSELEENRKLISQDPLTGTENRRAMGTILDREIARSRRKDEPLAVAMIDIDHFKKVNDQHGHAAGDAALVHLTRIARAMLRGNDAFIRYGGEEFLLVLPETGLQGGVFATERLKQMLEKNPVHTGSKLISMTFSAGVAVLQNDDSEESLLGRADAALYEAKNSGRNRVVAKASG